MPDEIEDAIKSAATSPKRVKGDEGEVEMHGIKELVEADRYIETKDAAKGKPRFGLIPRRTIPPGAV